MGVGLQKQEERQFRKGLDHGGVQPHLGQKVASEMSVPYDIMGDTQGHNVCQSLYLMDDSISVGHLGPVLHCWLPV